MAFNSSQRRNLAKPELSISKPLMEATGKRQPKSTTTTTAATSTVYNLTNHFARLHTAQKPTKSQNPPPLQVKALSKSAILESSKPKPSLGQNMWKQGKRVVLESDKKKIEREISKEERHEKSKSFCDAQVELANFLLTNCAKVVSADMPPFIQIHAVGFARKTKDSLEKFTSKSLALSLKKEFDGVYGPAWHCIVGSSFGSFVTHSVGGFLYFSLDQKLYILLFKTTVQRAD